MEKILVSGPSITQKEIDYVTDAVTNAWHGNSGIYHERFERAFGILEIHHFDQGQVRAAGDAILDFYEIKEEDRLAPVIKTNQIITGVAGPQSMLINRMRHGDLIAEGETLYVMECHPAGYAMIAANEAEKASPVNLLEMRAVGAFGRLYLGGYEEEIKEAQRAVTEALSAIAGRPNN